MPETHASSSSATPPPPSTSVVELYDVVELGLADEGGPREAVGRAAAAIAEAMFGVPDDQRAAVFEAAAASAATPEPSAADVIARAASAVHAGEVGTYDGGRRRGADGLEPVPIPASPFEAGSSSSAQPDALPDPEPTCALCGGTAAERGVASLRGCTRCHIVAYCCAEHQRDDWKVHSCECARAVHASTNEPAPRFPLPPAEARQAGLYFAGTENAAAAAAERRAVRQAASTLRRALQESAAERADWSRRTARDRRTLAERGGNDRLVAPPSSRRAQRAQMPSRPSEQNHPRWHAYQDALAHALALPIETRPRACAPGSLRSALNLHRGLAGMPAAGGRRHIPQTPERILDAPELLDDFYLNLLDWSSTNILSIALGDSIYLWDARDGKITQLVQTASDTHVTSLCFLPGGSQVAVGTSDHLVMVWDVEKLAQVRSMTGHSARVASLSPNGRLLSSGGRDSVVLHHDVRAAEHRVGCLKGHAQEVCGLKWSPSGQQLASGGNDNILNVWDERTVRRPFSAGGRTQTDTPLYRFDAHQAAVKALAWCPWQKHLLASGGGTADRTIRFWNTQGGTCLQGIDTKSQVCALQWAKHEKELVSAHGYSHNQVALWKYPSMVKAAELTGHTSRVLHMAQSPDGQTVVTAAADETLRFWKILSGDAAAEQEKHARASSLLTNAVLAVR